VFDDVFRFLARPAVFGHDPLDLAAGVDPHTLVGRSARCDVGCARRLQLRLSLRRWRVACFTHAQYILLAHWRIPPCTFVPPASFYASSQRATNAHIVM